MTFARPKYWVLAALTPLVIISDQITKHLIVEHFRLGESTPVWKGFFSLTYVRNTGAAFGIMAHANQLVRIPFFVVVPLVAIVAIAYIFRRIPPSDVRLSAALSLVIGGAIGNLFDRLEFGYVIDFLDFHWKYQYHFPAFNIADSAICVGVGALILDLVVVEPRTSQSGREVSQVNASTFT